MFVLGNLVAALAKLLLDRRAGLDDVVADATYYRPTELGAEASVKQRWERIRAIVRGTSR